MPRDGGYALIAARAIRLALSTVFRMPKVTQAWTHAVVGADHAALSLKQHVVAWLTAHGLAVEDMGTHSTASVDYPDIAYRVAHKVAAQQPAAMGVLLCGSGIGMRITANRLPHIRAALCMTPEMATLARAHNDANIVVLGARMLSVEVGLACLETFVATPFAGGRHTVRVGKLATLGTVPPA